MCDESSDSYGDSVPCATKGCDGEMVAHKNGFRCRKCDDAYCEHCTCYRGNWKSDDEYDCEACIDAKVTSRIKKQEGDRKKMTTEWEKWGFIKKGKETARK